MKIIVFSSTNREFPDMIFNKIIKVGLSYKVGIGLFWVIIHDDGTKTYINHKYYFIKRINDMEGANNEND